MAKYHMSRLIKNRTNMTEIEDLYNKKYLLLETYRKNSTPVKTPVWFVMLDNLIHIITRQDTGKIKRLKNNKSVKIASCTFNGTVTGDWFSGNVKFATEQKSQAAIQIRKKKYGFMERIARFVSRKKGNLIVFSIELE